MNYFHQSELLDICEGVFINMLINLILIIPGGDMDFDIDLYV